MNRVVKTAAISALVAATALTATLPASADHRRHHRVNGGELVAAGVLGLAAGALIAGANRRPDVVYRYDDPYYAPAPVYEEPVRYYEPPVRVYEQPVYVEPYASFEPWTREWYRYCGDRYRSFDPRSGTFMGYDGIRHFCVAN
ncbi:BA14K family protein [Mesorhizobium sp. CAU 1732]|jgi:hypothetical protein|uniref:BA14K family protein n=1 Tax=Mesorhizobium sp. CAU 1732 TaxID=3140358 RepID=UPI003260157B